MSACDRACTLLLRLPPREQLRSGAKSNRVFSDGLIYLVTPIDLPSIRTISPF